MHGYRAAKAFDGERALRDGALVLVDDGRVVGVEPGAAPAPAGCAVTDLPGATLLPGLVDAHVHLCADAGMRALDRLPELTDAEVDQSVAASLQAHLAAGVTTVRDLGDVGWAVADRHRGGSGPTVLASGPPLTCPGGHCGCMGGEVAGAAALRAAVRARVEHGVDVVKIMVSGGVMTPGTDVLACQFSAEEVRLVAEEAHRAGLPVTGHAHGLDAVERCVAAGLDGIEHCTCMTGDGLRTPTPLAAAIATAGLPVCPTLGRAPGIDPPPRIQALLARLGVSDENLTAHTGELHRAGVRLVGGTDAGINPGKPHGLMAECVRWLRASGLPAEAALAAATSNAARACGLGARTGRLAAGFDADLLAVDGDPVAVPEALRAVRLVVSRGREVVSPAGLRPTAGNDGWTAC